jgi:transmembrane sensor
MNNISEEFIIRFLNGDLSPEEIMEVEKWMSSSAENQELFDTCRKIWLGSAAGIATDKFEYHAAWKEVAARINKEAPENNGPMSLNRNKTVLKMLQIAAMLIILVTVGAAGSWIIFSPRKVPVSDQYCEIMAPQGSKSLITLPDGSKAWINAGSKLSYRGDFNQSERVVNLEGEGYFDVTSNKARPFIVKTAHLKVKAYGTVFNVKAYPEDKIVETTLVEGMVEIETGDKAKNSGNRTYTLKPNQNIIYHIESGEAEQKTADTHSQESAPVQKAKLPEKDVQVINIVKPELYTSWKDENWVIEGMPLDELAVLLGRRYNSRIDIRDEALRQYKFTGTIQNETLEQVLVILSLTSPLEYTIGKGNVNWMINRNMEKNYSRILKK